MALEQIPAKYVERIEILVRADTAGATHGLLDYCREGNLRYSVGYELTGPVRAAILQIPENAWVTALDHDGSERENGQVAEITDQIDLGSWPERSRVIVRRERPHPGAQLSFTDHDGYRFQAILTDQTDHDIAIIECRHRQHAHVEHRLRDDRNDHDLLVHDDDNHWAVGRDDDDRFAVPERSSPNSAGCCGISRVGASGALATSPGCTPVAISQQRACPPPPIAGGGEGITGTVPTFTTSRSTGLAPSSSPCSIATSTPQTFLVTSPPTALGRLRSRRPRPARTACAANRPTSTRLEPASDLRGFNHWFTLVTPLRLAEQALSRLVVPARLAFVGAAPALPALPRSGCPQLQSGCCDSPTAESFHLRSITWRLVAHNAVVTRTLSSLASR